jgi:pimeloyl-ACP methyl ester carboxylesterase
MTDSVLNYVIEGDGRPTLFLHGFMESISMWDFIQFADLGLRKIFIDLPGHGNSKLDDESEIPSIQFMAVKVIELASSLKLHRYDVVGHSMGGYIALLLKELDSRCGKVVLLNSNFWEDSEHKKKDRIRMADLAFKAKDLLVREAIPGLFYRSEKGNPAMQRLIDEALHMTSEAIAYASLAMRSREAKRELLFMYPDDIVVVQGANDPLIPEEVMSQRIQGLTVSYYILPNVGHMSHIEDPESVISLFEEMFNV